MPDGATDNQPGWLIVEDEFMIAMLVDDAISEIGLTPLGPAATVASALALINEQRPQGAILDVNLGGEPVYPVAELLTSLKVPFILVTGYGDLDIRERYPNAPVLQKPFAPHELQALVSELHAAHQIRP